MSNIEANIIINRVTQHLLDISLVIHPLIINLIRMLQYIKDHLTEIIISVRFCIRTNLQFRIFCRDKRCINSSIASNTLSGASRGTIPVKMVSK
jgi:hypothetical protein